MARSNGLVWQRTADAIRAFVSQLPSDAPRRAVFCTFDFDAERFEAVIFPELLRRGRQFRTLILSDAGAFQAQIQEPGRRRFGRYQMDVVRCPHGGVFHPKLILVAAGPKLLVGIGSANLTSGGLGGNLELMLFRDSSTDEGRQLIGGVVRFLGRLVTYRGTRMPESAREFIKVTLAQATLAGVPPAANTILHSLDVALLGQMSRAHFALAHRQATARLTIMSPWHSSGASAQGVSPAVLRKLQHSFMAEQMAVFTEGKNGFGPALGRGVNVHIRTESERSPVRPDEVIDNDALENAQKSRPMRVHAKAYLAEATNGGGTFFFGSANCTMPALTRPAYRGGNVEILVASELDQRAVDAIRAELADLFKAPTKTSDVERESAPTKPAGAILAGHIISTGTGVYLELEAPSVSRGNLFISQNADGPKVGVPACNGIARVTNGNQIEALFDGDVPTRDGNSWGCVLWERVGRKAVPFPVSIPLLAGGGDSPQSVLLDLVWEELGIWPAAKDGELARDDDPEVRAEDDDMEALAAAKHEGQLDRLAVSIAVLRRRILKSVAGREYAAERMNLLRAQVRRFNVASHIKNVLLKHLHPPVPVFKGKERR